MKYYNTGVVFKEIPDETTLSINISNCPCRCPGCHSSYLWDDVGRELTEEAIDAFASHYGRSVTCISFMGGDACPSEVEGLAAYVHRRYPHYKVSWWSGRQYVPPQVDKLQFDYIKVGPYLAHLGGLDSPQTNQRLLKKRPDGGYDDITSRFWKTR